MCKTTKYGGYEVYNMPEGATKYDYVVVEVDWDEMWFHSAHENVDDAWECMNRGKHRTMLCKDEG